MPGRQSPHSDAMFQASSDSKPAATGVVFLCPACRRRDERPLWDGPTRHECRHCGAHIELDRGAGEAPAGPIGTCGFCGGRWLYLQRDFNQKIGCAIVLAGIATSYHTYGLSLVAAALIDFALYRWLPAVTVCYACQAHYRGVAIHPDHRPYDLQVGETTARELESGIAHLRNLPPLPGR